jgi:hypothetical protein
VPVGLPSAASTSIANWRGSRLWQRTDEDRGDHARITSRHGRKTTGGRLHSVENLDYAKWRDQDIEPMTIPARPRRPDRRSDTVRIALVA